jgi:hypothetical protein
MEDHLYYATKVRQGNLYPRRGSNCGVFPVLQLEIPYGLWTVGKKLSLSVGHKLKMLFRPTHL